MSSRSRGDLLVERDRAQDAGVEAGLQAAQRELPRGPERRDLEDLHRVVAFERPQRRLAGQLERRVHDAPRVRGRQVHLGLAVAVGARQLGEGAVQFLAAGQDAVDDHAAVVACRQLHLPAGAARREVILDVGVDDLVDRAEVGGDAGRSSRAPCPAGTPCPWRSADSRSAGDELVDLRRVLLAVAVDAADPLLQPGRVERDVEVDQPVAVRLQVDALAGGVGGDEDPDLLLVRRRGELRPDVLPLLGGVEPWITASRSPSR